MVASHHASHVISLSKNSAQRQNAAPLDTYLEHKWRPVLIQWLTKYLILV